MRFSIRKACPGCGKPMVVVPGADDERPLRYVCTACGDDPLRDPTARKWADSPLKPPGALGLSRRQWPPPEHGTGAAGSG